MSANIRVVNLSGDVTISSVKRYADQILEILDGKASVLLSLSQATDIDLAGVQLLYAARRCAESRKKELDLTGPVSEPIARRLYRSGFTESMVYDGLELGRQLHGFAESAAPDA